MMDTLTEEMSLLAPYMGKRGMTDREVACLREASCFLTVRGTFHAREVNRHASLAEALDAAKRNPGPRPWMIYAHVEQGREAHLVNVR